METVEQLVSFNHIQVQLHGGAPWGFTLKGGLEHGEPLIITKIEEGGKAAQCKKLRVGDELVNINGSALYGSRQEALILIKGSYRILKITVRRRSVPIIRPHSWHLSRLPEPPSALGTSGTADGPLAMQLHPEPFSVPWHSRGENSDLSMQWGHLSRHYSTDRSSSVGSMESLENPPSQGYYDSQLSPVDPAIFNNKRDSAYSSFSASSNTSDYTVSLRPDEANSMDNLLQGLGSSWKFTEGRPSSSANGPGEIPEEGLKSRSLSRQLEGKVRPSSYSYEEDRSAPPQPPMRKDSFRATRGRPGVTDKRCVSAPVGIPSLSCCLMEDLQQTQEVQSRNFHMCKAEENRQECKGNSTGPYYTLISERAPCSDCSQEGDIKKNQVQDPDKVSPSPSPLPPTNTDGQRDVEEPLNSQLILPENKYLLSAHRHSAPEKLLASQLQLAFPSDRSDISISPCSQWSQSPLHPRDDLCETSPDAASQGKWCGSRCSTPGSVATLDSEDPRLEGGTLDSRQTPSPVQHHWGRSISVPGEPVGKGDSGCGPSTASCVLSSDFAPLSTAASVDTLLAETEERGGGTVGGAEYPKPSQRRQFRSSKSRRRSERFATNLRNEIQRKKAQLQKSKGPGGLLYSGEMVEEEETGELQLDEEAQSKPAEIHQPKVWTKASHHASWQTDHSAQAQFTGQNSTSKPQQRLVDGPVKGMEPAHLNAVDPQDSKDDQNQTQPPEQTRQVSVRVVEELAPVGKARRWRWTPEHKLQPELEPTERRKGEDAGQTSCGTTGRIRVGKATSSSSRLSSRLDECDIPPFADRMKFFEETSRNLSMSVSNLSGLTSRRQRPERHGRQPCLSSADTLQSAQDVGRRRFSYQGGVQDGASIPAVDSRRQSVTGGRERDKEIEIMREHERECEREQERLRELERLKEEEQVREQERIREQERLKEWEKEDARERQREMEEREREREEHRDREKGEQQRVLQREREWETAREPQHLGHDLHSDPVTQSVCHEAKQKQTPSLQNHSSYQPPACYHGNADMDAYSPRSAFHPVSGQQYQRDSQCLHPEYKPRSCTPTEAYPVREREQTKLNRNFSLTEKDYSRSRRDSRQGEGAVSNGFQNHWSNRLSSNNADKNPLMSSPLRSRAMSENDLRVATQRLDCANVGGVSVSALKEVDESGASVDNSKKKKGPPPPRPPPPNWEQFHRRRASHHNLFPSPPPSSNSSTSSPQPSWAPILPPQPWASRNTSALEMTRQRSYSLPPREGTESCQRCCQDYPQAPPSPAFTHRAFKPVAPPPRERETPSQHQDIHRSATTSVPEIGTRISDPSTAPHLDQPRPAVVKPVSLKHRGVAEWDRTTPQNPTGPHSTSTVHGTTPPLENGTYGDAVTPESYFAMNYNYQQHLQHHQRDIPNTAYKNQEPSVRSATPGEDRDVPLETDIDEYHENEGGEEEGRQREQRTEIQCFAQPATVLETDIDTLPEEEAQVMGARRGPRGSLVDSLLDEECGTKSRQELIGELFPHSPETVTGGGSWRGGYPVMEHSGDTLERHSKSDSSSKTHLLNKMDFSEISNPEEDEELNYKKQLMESLRKKLGVLREAQRGLQEDIRANAQLGEEVESLVLAVCKPNEVDKYRMFIGDLDKVVSLLLSLSSRLLRVESALDCLDSDSGHSERLPLLEKKKQLLAQLGEAQELKEHVDRREQAVGRVLGRCLTPEQLRDYSHFVKMKAALLVEQRQLEDKIRLGEEQLRGLRESLGLGLGVGMGAGIAYGL
ncbi:protein Shroom4 [Chanos chanos]|uniref:Protein Shroom4 n=1 Tax=Chanos chanos TaxID=29144 RepID=A0A6J2VT39_CHACN|nr:protein Shroom4-like [Chanos chanos]